MRKAKESSVDLLKRALDREFGDRPACYATFENGHLKLDLDGFLASEAGQTALKADIEACKQIPMAPGAKRITWR